MESFIDRLTNNLVVAAFVPSLVFCSLLTLIFRQQISPVAMSNIVDLYKEIGIFILVIAFAISLFLVYLRELIFRIYKGEYFPKVLSKFEARRAMKIKKKIISIKTRVEELEQSPSSDTSIIFELKDQWYYLAADYHIQFPSDSRIVSTRLGNILGAAEDCTAARYKLDPIPLWPRLTQLIPTSNFQKMDDAMNQLSLLINSSFLSFVFCLIVGTLALISWFNFRSVPIEYVASFLISLVLSYLFYVASLPLSQNYARMYCSVFDLFRFELIKQMRLAYPDNSEDEAITWRMISEFLAVGTDLGELCFEYKHPEELSTNRN